MATKTKTKKPLTDEELAAVLAYAEDHGPKWKQKLQVAWMRGSAPGVLHRLRNTHGPVWLDHFRLEGAGR